MMKINEQYHNIYMHVRQNSNSMVINSKNGISKIRSQYKKIFKKNSISNDMNS